MSETASQYIRIRPSTHKLLLRIVKQQRTTIDSVIWAALNADKKK